MGSPSPLHTRALAIGALIALVAAGFTVAESASADPRSPVAVSGDALPTAQVNGVVWSQAVVGGIDYVGGSFSESQPAGAADGVDVTPRSNLFAYDVASGAALPGFSAVANGQVRGVAASPDGTRIYIVGDFTTVNGQSRNHIAALDPSGNLIDGFAPNVNGNVYAVATRGDRVYFGGSFTAVAGQTRARAAAVTTDGALLTFAPAVADYVVRAVAISNDSSKVLLGGSFSTVGGEQHRGMAAVDSTTGAILPWAANNLIFNNGSDAAIYSLSTRGTVVYATAYLYGGGVWGNLEGSISMNWSDGSTVWVEDCHGDTYSGVPFNDAFYVAGHPHECRTVPGGFTGTDPATYHRAVAFSQAATGQLAHNTIPNYFDFGGNPAPTQLDWYPSFNTGTYTGSTQGPWSVAAGSSYVVYGGEFTKVNGARQTGLTRFLGQPEAADGSIIDPTPTPTPMPTDDPGAEDGTPGQAPAKPTAVKTRVLGPTHVAVRWTAPKHSDVKITDYVVTAVKGDRVLKRSTVTAKHSDVVLTGLKRSTTYRIVVTSSADGASAKAKAVLVRTKTHGANVSATKHPAKVAKPKAADRGAHAVRVSWKAAGVTGATPVDRYQVRVYKGPVLVNTVTVSGSKRAAMVKELKAGTAYRFQVRAANWAGYGTSSTKAGATTQK